ncbi:MULTISPECIES: ABC transporter thiamine pyrophosphate-binding lipoprotein p37/Cypl [unclassified Mycoplasma]|uniref:ABC transporter thiamine pyrophosphate-binding lipoprotein p37/Cypl n=1 Tax=unclassified Mycoplasma TaxID=2683645 RepID=UPI00211C921A|nr:MULTISPECIES: P37-like ABC transporter substrate-binding lipoprotein [unclassified Mycoplasma]UUM19808.1 P37-like ABC transporter substrate-binding lipoprotein [Mycoplasma sp. 1578d]UUM24792.1 P37-like ABC transporter substrate-binding lipoprotein [Mycoplasma sp. 3686d]
MYKIFKKIKPLILGSLGLAPLVAASCTASQTNTWDTDIKFLVPTPNSGYTDEQKTKWENVLTKHFNDLKNKDNSLKQYKDVSIKLVYADDTGASYQQFLANNPEQDFMILSYSTISKQKTEDLLPTVAQTQTYKFLWTPEIAAKFENKKDKDPLYEMAQKANTLQLENKQFGEYPTWTGEEKERLLKWDGSKYGAFYKTNEFTENFYGSILISGTPEIREKIKKAWLDKDWDTFKSYGILYKKTSSLSKYIAPVSVIAQNFGKTYKEISDYLTNQNNFVLSGKGNEKNLGVETTDKKTYRIGFDYDGVFNFTQAGSNFKPTKYPNEQIRYLTMAGPLFYDAVLSRKKMPLAQQKLFTKALEQLTQEENTYGIFSGFNKFVPLTNDKLQEKINFLKQQFNG